MKTILIGMLAVALMATPSRAAVRQPFSLICQGGAIGNQTLQLDIHAAEGWYASGSQGGRATYENAADAASNGAVIDLLLTGTLRWRGGTAWTLTTHGHEEGLVYACRETKGPSLSDASNPFF